MSNLLQTETQLFKQKRLFVEAARRIGYVSSHLSSGSTFKQSAEGWGIKESTLKSWVHRFHIGPKRKSGREVNEELDKRLTEWFDHQRDVEGLTVRDEDLQEEALRIGGEMSLTNFVASSTWVAGFRKRIDIVRRRKTKTLRRTGFTETDVALVESYYDAIIEAIEHDQIPEYRIFNADQTSVPRVITTKWTLSRRGVRQVTAKDPTGEKDNLSVMLSVSLLGEKQKAIVIFKRASKYGKDPRFFSKLDVPPNVVLMSAPKGWWNMELDKKWLENHLRSGENADVNYEIVLVRDRLSSHNSSCVRQKLEELNIRHILVPSGQTGELQPLDVGVMGPFKAALRREYLQWRKQLKLTTGKLKPPSHQDRINFISRAWDSISVETIRNAFKGAWAEILYPGDEVDPFPEE